MAAVDRGECERHVRLFGYPGVYERGERLGPPPGVCSLLFGHLVLHRGGMVSEQRLSEAVWGYGGTSDSALRSAISRLRAWGTGLLGDAFELRHAGGGYRLTVAGIPVDLAALDAVGRGGGSAAGPEFDHLFAAAARIRGVFLDGTPAHYRHACGEKDAYAKLSALCIRLADAAADLPACARALPEVRRLSVIMDYEPLVRAALVRLLDRAGLRYEAVEAQRAAIEMCRVQLRIPPPEALRRAVSPRAQEVEEPEVVMHGVTGVTDVMGVMSPAAVLPTALSLPRPPAVFVGRARERMALDDWARAGGTTAFVVAGMPGIGKSALLREAAAGIAGLRPVIWVDADEGATLADLVRAMLLQLTGDRREVPGRLIDGQLLLRRLTSQYGAIVCVDGLPDASVLAPLLPSLPPRTLLVTSRRLPVPMEDATVLRLAEFSAGESLAFVATVAKPGTPAAPGGALALLYRSVGGHPGALRAVVSRAGLLRRLDEGAVLVRTVVRTFLSDVEIDLAVASGALVGRARRAGEGSALRCAISLSPGALVVAERLVRHCLADYVDGPGAWSEAVVAVPPLVALLLREAGTADVV